MLLRIGSTGELVKSVQVKLGLVADGNFGPKTDLAVKEFQRKNKIKVDGIINDSTLIALGIVIIKPINKLGITEQQYIEAAKLVGCEVAIIKAVDKIEASGDGFLGNGDVKILFEPHIFWRELLIQKIDPNKHTSKNTDILYQRWKTGHYGKVSEQWGKMNRAIGINKEAALRSASYGRFQILGNNHRACGYSTVSTFVDAMKVSEYNHLLAFVNFVKTNRLDRFLITKDWEKFAEGYNGPGFRKNNYHIKLQNAYNSFIK